MKICFIGPANSAHIVKWCRWFSGRGHEIHVISFTEGKIENAQVHLIDISVNTGGGDLGKLKYMLTGGRIRKIVEEIKPDIVNVHYATSYGVAVALSGLKGYYLSVWGSDIYSFPKKSPLHKALLKFSLKRAGHLFSTSQAMADEAALYTDRKFHITPFGVDMELFDPSKRTRTDDGKLIMGTVKTLADLYGIEYILRAAAIVREKRPDLDICLRIAGDGPDAEKLKALAKDLRIDEITNFLGRIPQEEAAKEWANMDMAVIPSILYESFGVAAVEAEACGTPVIISDVGGLKEATCPGESSIVVPTKDAAAIADAMIRLADDKDLRAKMGARGREYALEKFEINTCFLDIEEQYMKTAKHN